MENTENKKDNSNRTLWYGIGVVLAVVAITLLVGLWAIQPEPEMIMGEVSANEYRVSNKVPGRIDTIYISEGSQVKSGDTLAYINSPDVDAKLEQAQAAKAAATAQSKKANNGARQQQIAAAYEMWQKAEVGVDIAKKSLDRTKSLYDKKVISAQKYDEVDAQYRAAVATANAAKMQYEMAKEGAQAEDIAAANALVSKAKGAVAEVESYMGDRYLIAPCDGEVVEIYAKRRDLIGTGSPVLSIVDMNDIWFTFSVREDLLKGLTVGSEVRILIPALGDETYSGKITYMRAMASYATWRATKVNGQYDVKSFDLKVVPTEHIANIRPGMTALIVDEE